ncbi:Hcp family type VI secretion system effector [Burkholderia sp. MR1-5-21]
MAVDMFIKLDTIKGESKDDKHNEEIDVLAFSWGMSQSGSMHMATGGGAGKVNVQDLSFTKYVDKASPTIMLACCKGTHLKEVVFTVRKAGDNPLEYYKITMKEVLISSVSTGGSGGEDRFTENVVLNFAKVKVDYQAQSKTGGKEGGPVDMKWDIPANKEGE